VNATLLAFQEAKGCLKMSILVDGSDFGWLHLTKFTLHLTYKESDPPTPQEGVRHILLNFCKNNDGALLLV
jgi:hypothetical protein